MTYCDVALGELIEVSVRKNFGDEPHTLVVGDFVGKGDGYAAALLPPVLKGVKSVIYGVSDRAVLGGIYAEHAALFVNFFLNVVHMSPQKNLFLACPAICAEFAGVYPYGFY